MIRINLIPYREEMAKLRARKLLITFAASFVILVLVVGSFHTWMTLSISALERQVTDSRTELDRLKKLTGDIDKYREDKALAEKKLQVITSLEKNRDEGYLLLREFSLTVPEGDLWLTLLSKRGTDLRTEGMAKDNRTIALFMERLTASPEILSVDLVAVRQVPYAGTELKSFTLTGSTIRR
ncbi:MAG: PilN domain-containing protein [Syntrophales bacterium]|jgi:Tfp pilus assembly protein PilN|nr:PilN domain-containing protein [Syntrophales bacterium]MCK9527509.1 PilN domain-containing protein [Syntrophales bacterium]MDX9922566.1 PilN domain-containing protein [Syntrophales bacterium]